MTLPHASTLLDAVRAARAARGHLFVGLDYDGTLTGIVPRPEDAHLAAEGRAVLQQLAGRPDTVVAILSGRALADVRERVGVTGVWYAGNHGLEIAGPGLERVHPGAAATAPSMRRLAAALGRALAGVEGASVEDKGITLSVHFRRVPEARQGEVRDVALGLARQEPGVRATQGKLVVELRPDVAWDKGAALRFIRDAIGESDVAPALFIGDDTTDEDAFRALPPGGWGIIVVEQPGRLDRPTAARAHFRTHAEVIEWLGQLAEVA